MLLLLLLLLAFISPQPAVCVVVAVNVNPLTTLAYGSALRVLSEVTLGCPLENLKVNAALSDDPVPISSNIRTLTSQSRGGLRNLWRGTPSRVVEGSLIGGMYLLGSTVAKSLLVKSLPSSPTVLNTVAAISGGVAQSVVLTPTTNIFTTVYKENVTVFEALRIVRKDSRWRKGASDLVFRQCSNWACRSFFTSLVFERLNLASLGAFGQILSGVLGGYVSTINTPLEVVRVRLQAATPKQRRSKIIKEIYERKGIKGFYAGANVRGLQAAWQTIWMIIAPRLVKIC